MAEVKMEDLKPNSHNYNRVEVEKTEDKKVEKVVSEPVTRKKRSLGRKFVDIFFSENVGDVKTYLVYDVLVPAIKENIADIVNGAVSMLFFCEVRRRGNAARTQGNASRVNYGGYFNGGNDRGDRDDHGRKRQYPRLLFPPPGRRTASFDRPDPAHARMG